MIKKALDSIAVEGASGKTLLVSSYGTNGKVSELLG